MNSAFRNLMFQNPNQRTPRQRAFEGLYFPENEETFPEREIPEERTFIQNYRKSDPRQSEYYKMLDQGVPQQSDYERGKGAKIGSVLLGSLLESLGDSGGMEKSQGAIRAPYERAVGDFGNRLETAKGKYSLERAFDDDNADYEQAAIKLQQEEAKRKRAMYEYDTTHSRNVEEFRTQEARQNRALDNTIRDTDSILAIRGRSPQFNTVTGELGTFNVANNGFTSAGKFRPSFQDTENSKIANDRRQLGNSLTLSRQNFANQRALKDVPQVTSGGSFVSAADQDSARKLAIRELLTNPSYQGLEKAFDENGNISYENLSNPNDPLLPVFSRAVQRRIDEILGMKRGGGGDNRFEVIK